MNHLLKGDSQGQNPESGSLFCPRKICCFSKQHETTYFGSGKSSRKGITVCNWRKIHKAKPPFRLLRHEARQENQATANFFLGAGTRWTEAHLQSANIFPLCPNHEGLQEPQTQLCQRRSFQTPPLISIVSLTPVSSFLILICQFVIFPFLPFRVFVWLSM